MRVPALLIGIALAGAAPVFGGSALANEPLELERQVVITNEMGESRVLLGFQRPADLSEVLISNASLDLALAGGVLEEDLLLEMSMVATPWGGSATWTRPWMSEGGDLDGQQGVVLPILAGATPTRVTADVTNMVRANAEGRSGWSGFILYPGAADVRGFRGAERDALEVVDARITIHYRDLPDLGLRGGPAEQLARREQRRRGSRASTI